ncbi:MAG TPA: hypothetical protein VK700_11375 [Steroidobacteraceae bacterium]|jgi:hypothetical protein|nr:hypothetical protein [Steroidobacteraceae bacterium]
MYARKIVLNCPSGYTPALAAMVEDFIKDGVAYVGVVGSDCARIEDIIDELVVGDGSGDSRYILTASHPGESLDGAVEIAESLTGEYEGAVQVVEL